LCSGKGQEGEVKEKKGWRDAENNKEETGDYGGGAQKGNKTKALKGRGGAGGKKQACWGSAKGKKAARGGGNKNGKRGEGRDEREKKANKEKKKRECLPTEK